MSLTSSVQYGTMKSCFKHDIPLEKVKVRNVSVYSESYGEYKAFLVFLRDQGCEVRSSGGTIPTNRSIRTYNNYKHITIREGKIVSWGKNDVFEVITVPEAIEMIQSMEGDRDV